MPLYICECCNFSTKIKSHYIRHEKTKKHGLNFTILNSSSKEQGVNAESSSKCPQFPSISLNLGQKVPQKLSKIEEIPQNSGNSGKSELKKFVCEFCNRGFSRNDNLKRHLKTKCGGQNETNIYKQLFLETRKQLLEEKNELKKQIEVLLTKVGNTTYINNSTQNIQLNSYGNEDLSHITESFKTNLLKGPFGMIPKMIEAVHFNHDKPENQNISYPNKKENKIKIFTEGKWVYRNKSDAISDLVDGKYFILDTHYESVCDKFNETNKKAYENFRSSYDENDKLLIETLKNQCELTLLNNR